MKKEDLIALGIEDEEIQDELFKLHGIGIEKLKTENTELTEARDTLTSQLEEAQQTIESFAEKEMNFEEIQTAAEEYKQKYEEAEKTKQEEIQKLKFDHALNDVLKDARARNIKAVRALLELDELEMNEEGEIEGLSDQIEAITIENDFLFEAPEPEEPEEPEPRIVTGSKKKRVLGDSVVQAAREGAGISGKG